MGLLAFILLYGLALLVLAVVHAAWQVHGWANGTSQPLPKIAGCWFTLAARGALVIPGANGQPRPSTTIGTTGPSEPTSASPHFDPWCWLAPLTAAILRALARAGRRSDRDAPLPGG